MKKYIKKTFFFQSTSKAKKALEAFFVVVVASLSRSFPDLY